MGRFIENLCKIQLNSNLIFYESYQHYCQTFEGNHNIINPKYIDAHSPIKFIEQKVPRIIFYP